MQPELKSVIAEHIRAVNTFDLDAIVNSFAKDAYVNDNRREIAGIDAILEGLMMGTRSGDVDPSLFLC